MTASMFLAMFLLVPVTPETARFTIKQNGQTIGTEEFTIRAEGKGFVAEGRTQLKSDSNALTSRMVLDEYLNPTSYEYTRGRGSILVRVKDPTSDLTIVDGGSESSTNFRFLPGTAIVDNNFFHHYLLLLYRMKDADRTFPVFVPQDMLSGQARIRSTGDRSFTIDVGEIRFNATVDSNGRLMKLEVPSAKVVVERRDAD